VSIRELSSNDLDEVSGGAKGGDMGHGKEADLGGGWNGWLWKIRVRRFLRLSRKPQRNPDHDAG
jgi:hypothetical protein